MVLKKRITSFDYFHSHTWNPKKKSTSVDGKHKHKIDLKKKLALPAVRGGHTHKLL